MGLVDLGFSSVGGVCLFVESGELSGGLCFKGCLFRMFLTLDFVTLVYCLV